MSKISQGRQDALDQRALYPGPFVARATYNRKCVYLASEDAGTDIKIMLSREEVVSLLEMMPEAPPDPEWVEL